MRFIPREVSDSSSVLAPSTGAVKLGQPERESYFVSDENNCSPQTTHRFFPDGLSSTYSSVNGLSVLLDGPRSVDRWRTCGLFATSADLFAGQFPKARALGRGLKVMSNDSLQRHSERFDRTFESQSVLCAQAEEEASGGDVDERSGSHPWWNLCGRLWTPLSDLRIRRLEVRVPPGVPTESL